MHPFTSLSLSSDCTPSPTQKVMGYSFDKRGFVDGLASQLLAHNMSQCSARPPPPASRSNRAAVVRKGALLLLLQLLMIFEACGQWELLFVIWRFFTVEYISLYGARFDPCAAAEKGQTIIFFSSPAPCGRKRDWCGRLCISPRTQEARQLSWTLAPSFPFPLSYRVACMCTPQRLGKRRKVIITWPPHRIYRGKVHAGAAIKWSCRMQSI
jgi:hypothetical protein